MNIYKYSIITTIRGVALAMLLAAGGCATVIKGSHQTVPMASVPPGADVLVDGTLVGQTPLKVEMKRKHDHLVTIQKTGYKPESIAVVKDVGGAVWGNIIAGGLIGWGVDASTGAQYNLTPKTVSVELKPASSSMGSSGSSEASDFVTKLKTLDDMKENKQISDEEYGKARLELFRKYMPEALPPEAAKEPAEEPAKETPPG